jgi:hypothetical protein
MVDIAALRSRRFLILLSTLAVVGGVESLNQSLAGILIITDALLVLVVLAVFFVVFERTHQRLATLAAAIVAIGILGARYVVPSEHHVSLSVVHDALLALFFGWAVIEILRGLFVGKPVQRDDILGAVCGYLIAGGAWANLYALLELLSPGSFSVSADLQGMLADWHRRHALFNYFSFVTLTTVGYGDVTPDRAPATTLALVEAVFGQFYVAVVVAQIVAMRLAQAVNPGRPGAPRRGGEA